MTPKNALYAQSGGVTAVINATASAVIESARANQSQIKKLYAGKNGILGVLQEELIDTSLESIENVRALSHTPGGAFGSCRLKLKDFHKNAAEFKRLFAVFAAHDIGYFFYNGGGDSQDTTHKISQYAKEIGYPLICIGIPKTIDNDLPFTDNCPGFGSAAKYTATSIREAGFDIASMSSNSTKVFLLESMGRHSGWLAAASGLASTNQETPPHLILFPEITFQQDAFLAKVNESVTQLGYCTIVASEGIKSPSGEFLSHSHHLKDDFGHVQLGGVVPILASIIKHHLGLKYHWGLPDYLQRSARHIASAVDLEQAYAVGKAAVDYALAGKSGVMITIKRLSDSPYLWEIADVPLSEVANVEKEMPAEFISADGFHITDACRNYLNPLIQGEAYPPFINGLPDYIKLKNECVAKKLESFRG